MTRFEYKVIPAPGKGRKGPGIKGPEARFAHGLEEVMNEMGAEGWEYQRSDILPSEERQGLTSSHTIYRSVLVFRRVMTEDAPADIIRPAPPEATSDEDPPAAADAPDETSDTDQLAQEPETDDDEPNRSS